MSNLPSASARALSWPRSAWSACVEDGLLGPAAVFLRGGGQMPAEVEPDVDARGLAGERFLATSGPDDAGMCLAFSYSRWAAMVRRAFSLMSATCER